MKALVSGVAGLIGSHLAKALSEDGYEVIGIDNLVGGYRSNVPDEIEFHDLDCLDRSIVTRIMQDSDVVFHCAAAAYEGLSVFAPAYVYMNVLQASVEMATAAASAGVRHFVHCSSMSRYGDIPSPFTEDQTPRPVTPYGVAKLASEQAVANIMTLHGGTYSIAIPHSVIGTGQRYDDPYRNVAGIMINRMLQGRQPIIYGDGSSVRCFSHIDDVVSCLGKMASEPAARNQVINIGPDRGEITILQLAEKIAALMHFDLDPIFVPPRLGEVAVATCSSDKARSLLGYRTTVELEDGLAAMVAWISSTGAKPFTYNIPLEIDSVLAPETWKRRLI